MTRFRTTCTPFSRTPSRAAATCMLASVGTASRWCGTTGPLVASGDAHAQPGQHIRGDRPAECRSDGAHRLAVCRCAELAAQDEAMAAIDSGCAAAAGSAADGEN